MQESFQVWKMGKTVFLLSGDSIHTLYAGSSYIPKHQAGKTEGDFTYNGNKHISWVQKETKNFTKRVTGYET